MPKQISDEWLTEEIQRGLHQSPFPNQRIPSAERIRMIQVGVKTPMLRNKRARLAWVSTGVFLACLIVIASIGVRYEMPGGWADQRMSRASGTDGTLHIPIGQTPQEAIEKFRNYSDIQIVHQEALEGGALVFYKRSYMKDGTDLEVEYVRKTWLGWKWGM
ncbi:MAG: hypothetical protein K6T85_19285, partial [Gorillibacterium sp.]|nr:hypothetical protein [Gorillibacterium sp.]